MKMQNPNPPRRSATARHRLAWALVCGCLWAAGRAAAQSPAHETAAAPAAGCLTNSLLAGTRFATAYYINDSGVPGPTIFIVGGVHGNEPAGARAAERIRLWPILKGKLLVVPRANVPALMANKRLIPNLGTNLSNLNRNYPRAGKEEGPRGDLASAIWNLALNTKPNWVLDLHEGYDFHQLNEKSVGSSVICFPHPQGLKAVDLMLAAVNRDIQDERLKFVRRNMPIDGSLARAGGEHLHVPSMTLETTSKQPMEKRIYQQEVLVHCLLQQLGMVSGSLPALASATAVTAGQPSKPLAAPRAARLRIALYKGPGTGGKGPPSLMKRLNRPPETSITEVTPADIQAGALTNFQVVIFGGGSGSKEAESIGELGRSNVVQFVSHGGGYVGICAGAYLATSGYPWSLRLVNVRTVSPKWQRGRALLELELTRAGSRILGNATTNLQVVYHNGPVVKPAGLEALPPFETLAFFRTEVASNGTPAGVMVNSPAIIAAPFQNGRVLFCSPHPEQTPGLEDLIPRAVLWAAGLEDKTRAGAPTKDSNAEQ